MFQLTNLLPKNLAQSFTAGLGHRRVVGTAVAFERGDGRAWGNAQILPDFFKAGPWVQA